MGTANGTAFTPDAPGDNASGAGEILRRGIGGTLITPDSDSSRIRTGLLPGFFSFNVRSPEVGGLRGSARISFAPQIQNANTKNAFGSQIDFREMFFNIDGDFGTVSVGRTLSLHQRHNILTDMTLFGVGAQGGQGTGATTLGRIGYGYVYPQFNARISYKTPDYNGFQLEVGAYDPSKIVTDDGAHAWTETDTPRLEMEATYASSYNGGNFKLWGGAMWQEASDKAPLAIAGFQDDVSAYGVHGGIQLGYQGLEVVFSGYFGEALGTALMLDFDSVDYCGDERENFGFVGQLAYTFNERTKFGVSYGESGADETDTDEARRLHGAVGCSGGNTFLTGTTEGFDWDTSRYNEEVASWVATDKLSAITVGVYHDVTSWFKVVAEYSRVENEWHDGASVEADVFSAGGFFLW